MARGGTPSALCDNRRPCDGNVSRCRKEHANEARKQLFELNQSVIPNDITLLINNNEIGLVLLRIAEFIGEDKLQDIGPETVYFMISILNELNLDKIRNEIILKVLPLKI